MSDRSLARPLGPVLAFACGWEAAALTTGVVPPWSHLLWRLPFRARLAIFLGVTALAFDHLFTRRLT